GHCHVVLAVLSWRFAHRLSRTPLGEVRHVHGWGAFGWTTLSSFLPMFVALAAASMKSHFYEGGVVVGAGLLVVILVGATVLGLIPATFAWMRRIIERERQALEGQPY